MNLLALAAVVVVVLRAHTAPADEARRVALFGCGFLMALGLGTLNDVVAVFSPGGWLEYLRSSPAVVSLGMLRFPGVVLLWYSVLAVRVPHLREAIRRPADGCCCAAACSRRPGHRRSWRWGGWLRAVPSARSARC